MSGTLTTNKPSAAWQHLELPSVPESTERVETYVQEMMDSVGFSQEVYARIIISLTEAVNNSIYHGNKVDPQKSVVVQASLTNPHTLCIRVTDQGTGFDPYQLPDPTAPENLEKDHGRGVFFIKTYADNVRYNATGNSLDMFFLID
jgi:serine/threonine-protein kinase RsbW